MEWTDERGSARDSMIACRRRNIHAQDSIQAEDKMRQYPIKLALAGLCLLLAGAARAGVTVNYIHADQFSDLPREVWQRQQALDDFAEHFRELGKDLRPGQDMVIDVLDIDLAGRERPVRFGHDPIRVLNEGADWPRMHLRYTLSDHGRTIASGDAQLADKSYTDHINDYPHGSRWPYEMQMIDTWWRKTIVPLETAGR
jgi:hypothetical protein